MQNSAIEAPRPNSSAGKFLARDSLTDPARYSKHELLGAGAVKRVYKAFDEIEGTEVAWNEIQLHDGNWSSDKDKARLFSEIRVLKQLKHRYIMKLYDWWFDAPNRKLIFITELFTDGNLRQYRKKHRRIEEQVLKRWAWQVLQGLVYLHGHNPPIIHRDLKSDNVFINGSSGQLKIGDLGFATLHRGLSTCLSVIGTPEFMAPELYEEKYDAKVDVYAFGMCLLELVTLEYPYKECSNAAQIYRKVSQGIPPQGLAQLTNEELRNFIRTCITFDPAARPSSHQLLKHPFFDSIRPPLKNSQSVGQLAALVEQDLPLQAPVASPAAGPNVAAVAAAVAQQQQQQRAAGSTSGRSTPELRPDARYAAAAVKAAPAVAAEARPLERQLSVEPPSPGAPAAARPPRPSSQSSGSFSAVQPRASDVAATAAAAGGKPPTSQSQHTVLLLGSGSSRADPGPESDVLQRDQQRVPHPAQAHQHSTSPGGVGPSSLLSPGEQDMVEADVLFSNAPDVPSDDVDAQNDRIEDLEGEGQNHRRRDGPLHRGVGDAGGADSADEDEEEDPVELSCRRLDPAQLSFDLRFDFGGITRRVGFQYNLHEDAPETIAREMLENLSLKEDQAAHIARRIRQELDSIFAASADTPHQ